jgi:hypothetical protein
MTETFFTKSGSSPGGAENKSPDSPLSTRSTISSSNHGDRDGRNGSRKTGPVQNNQANHVDPATSSGTSPGTRTRPDFHLFFDVPNPTVYLLCPLSRNACSWIADNISDDAMWFGSSLVVEHRYCAALIAQIERDGLEVSRG